MAVRLASALRKRAPKPIVRTFVFDAGNQAGTRLEVQLEYTAPSAIKDATEREQRRILGHSRFNRLEDQASVAQGMEQIAATVLAERVLAIRSVKQGDPAVRVRDIKDLVVLSPEDVADFGGFDSEIPLDCTQSTSLAEPVIDDGVTIKTEGELARANVRWLLLHCRRALEWVNEVIQDVSYFQDEDWEKSLGNSSAGATPPANS